MRIIKFFIILVLFIFTACKEDGKLLKSSLIPFDTDEEVNTPRDYSEYHQEALQFVKENKMNEDFYYLLDFSKHSGSYRFFRYSFSEDSITHSALVTHGACDVLEPNPDKLKDAAFSNIENSHCSSIGKYRIGNRDYSSWGVNYKYWLHGLESTNNNAKDRIIVLHSWNVVPDEEVHPQYIALSWGCPAVSNNFMNTIDNQIKKANNKNVLLWIIK